MFKWFRKLMPGSQSHTTEVDSVQFGEGYPEPHECIEAFCISPDGRYAFSFAVGRVTQWNLSTGETQRSERIEMPGRLLAMGSSGDHLYLIVDNALITLDRSWQVVDRQDISCNGLVAAAISSDARVAILGRRDEGVQCFSLQTYNEGCQSGPAAASRPDKPITFERNGRVFAWGSCVRHHLSRPSKMVIAKDNSYALSLSTHDQKSKLRVWSVADGSCLELQGYDGAFAIATDGRVGYSGRYCEASGTKSILMFDLKSGECLDSLDSRFHDHITALSVNTERNRLLIGDRRGNVFVSGVKSPTKFDYHNVVMLGKHPAPVSGVEFVSGNRVVSTSGNIRRCWTLEEACAD